MKTLSLWLPPLLSLTLAACMCLENDGHSDWGTASTPPSSTDYKPWPPTAANPRSDGGTSPDVGGRDISGNADAGCPGEVGGLPGACGAKPAPFCQFNNQCGPGGRCRDGACERPCAAGTRCGTGQVCSAGFCQAPLTAGGQCVYDRDCGSDNTCINGVCHGDCRADTDCGAEDRCIGGVCKPDTGPRPECRASTDCADGKMCVNAVCRAACATDADCCIDGLSGPTCRMGYCITAQETSPACRISADCSAGQCIDAVCN